MARNRKDSNGSPKKEAEVGEIDTRAPFQSVKAAVSLFGETISSTPPAKPTFLKKSKSSAEGVRDKETEYHFAEKELNKYKTQVQNAESAANKALPDLEKAMKTLMDLKDKLKTVNASKDAIVEETEALKIKAKELEEEKSSQMGENANAKARNADIVEASRRDYKAAVAELDAAKQELSSLRGDFDAAMEAKLAAISMAEEARLAAKAHSDKISQLTEQIESMRESLNQVKISTQETVEEQKKISAEKEEKERSRRGAKEEVERKMTALLQEKEAESEGEMVGSEALEMKLVETNKEIEVVKEKMAEAKKELSESEKYAYGELKAAEEALKQVQEEKQSLQDEVNVHRQELEKVGKEMVETKDKAARAESLAGQLRVDLQERKLELEAALASEEKSRRENEDMMAKIEQAAEETERAKKEVQEMNDAAEELQREIKAAEEMEKKLEMVMKEAEEAKAAERNAQSELKICQERKEAANNADLGNDGENKKVLSKEEYMYLKEKAAESKKMAERKVASLMAEMEALTASNDEAERKLGETLEEMEEIDKATEEAFRQAETAEAARSMVQNELQRRREQEL